MTAPRPRAFAALAIAVQVAGESLFEMLALALCGATDLALGSRVLACAGIYLVCLALLPRLRRRIPFKPDAER